MATKVSAAKKNRATRDNTSMRQVVFLRTEEKKSTSPTWTWSMAFHGRPLAFLVVAIFAIASLALTASGTSFDYYPQTCVGSWMNPENAQGQPTLQRSIASLKQFSANNSAVFYGGTHSIICQSFDGESIPEETTLSSLQVTLSLAIKHPVAPVATDPVPEDTLADAPDESLPEGASNESEFTIVDEPIPEEPAEDAPVDESAPESPVEEIVPSEETPADEPVVEEPVIESAPAEEPAPEPEPVTESEPEPTPEPSPEPEPAPEPSPEPSAFRIPFVNRANAQEQSDVLATVQYSLDGSDWRFLGNVTADSDWKNLAFDIPVGEGGVASVADLPNLRIRIDAGFFSVDSPIEIYFDGVEVEIRTDEYIVPEELIPGLEELDALTELPTVAMTFNQTFSLARTVIPAEEVLPWMEYDYRIENIEDSEEVSKSVAVENSRNDGITVSGACKQSYFTVLVFSDPEAYATAPRTALFNSAYPCDNGAYSYSLVPTTLNLPEGEYYLLVADQPESGPWIPISAIMPFTIEEKS
jgi:hypothetical protein